MKIISGKYRNKTLKTLEGMDTRPTISRVKESVFNIIQFSIADSTCLDLFAGSGQMGIECLSRGAKTVDFVDNNAQAIKIIEQNLKTCENTTRPHCTDFLNFLKSTKNSYDIVFLDPPFASDMLENSIFLINSLKLLNKCGIIICETSKDVEINLENTDLTVKKEYIYGSIKITVIKEN